MAGITRELEYPELQGTLQGSSVSPLVLKIKKNQVAGTSFLALFIPEPTVHKRDLLTLWRSGIHSQG